MLRKDGQLVASLVPALAAAPWLAGFALRPHPRHIICCMAVCPLCWNHADASLMAGPSGGVRAAYQIECKRCGSFVAGWMFQQVKESFSPESRFLLSAITRKATAEGRIVELTSDSARELLDSTPWPTAEEQDTLFLAYLSDNETRRGDPVPIDHKTDYALFFAKGEKESASIANELKDAGYIQRTDVSAIPKYALTRKGRDELQRRQRSHPAVPATPVPPSVATPHAVTEALVAQDVPKDYDVFLSHASEDKAAVTDPLYQLLVAAKCHVWYDQAILLMGDSLRRKIDDGLRLSRFGVVVLSPDFFRKNWPQHELDGLATREQSEGRKVILPIWHNVAHKDVLRYSAPLADKVAARTEDGLDRVVEMILGALGRIGPQAAPRRLATITANEAEEMRRIALRGGQPRCPADGGILDLQDTTTFGIVGRQFHASCPICGEMVSLNAPHRDA